MEWSDEWYKFLRFRLVPPQFPREVGKKISEQLSRKHPNLSGWRSRVLDADSYMMFLTENFNKMSCYTSLYSAPQMSKNLVDTVFLEIDDVDIPSASIASRSLEDTLERKKIKFRKYFSGRRGFHFYIDVEPVILKNPSLVMRAFARALPKVVDSHCVGNIRQMVRVPYTKHAETGLYCFRVSGTFKIADAISPPPDNGELEVNDALSEVLEAMDGVIEDARSKKPINLQPVDQLVSDFFPQCIVDCLDELQRTGELDHAQRLHMTSYLARVGYKEDQLVDLYKCYAHDFNERLTRLHVKGILDIGFSCYSCRRSQEAMICPYTVSEMKRCAFFPSINKTVSIKEAGR